MTPPASSSLSTSTAKSCQDLSFSIVWSPLPPITWIVPFIGHTGIADSRGVASDFQGPYFVGDQGLMAFGNPTRAIKIDIGQLPGGSQRWDEAIQEANQVYRGRMHNICCDNCHSHVANALNRMPVSAYGIREGKWDMVKICFLVFFRARFLSPWAFLCQFGPLMVACLIVVMVMTLK